MINTLHGGITDPKGKKYTVNFDTLAQLMLEEQSTPELSIDGNSMDYDVLANALSQYQPDTSFGSVEEETPIRLEAGEIRHQIFRPSIYGVGLPSLEDVLPYLDEKYLFGRPSTAEEKFIQVGSSMVKTGIDMGAAMIGAGMYGDPGELGAGYIFDLFGIDKPPHFDVTEMKQRKAMEFILDAQNWSDELLPGIEGIDDSFLFAKLPSGFASMLGFMAMGYVTKGAGMPAWLGAGLTGSAVEMGFMGAEAYDETGGNLDKTTLAWLAGVPVGFSEALPIGRMFKRLEKTSNGGFGKFMIQSLSSGIEEAIQEYGQTVGENLTAKALYDASREWDEGAAEGGFIGFITGATMFAGSSYLHRLKKRKQDKKDKEIAEKYSKLYDQNMYDRLYIEVLGTIAINEKQKSIKLLEAVNKDVPVKPVTGQKLLEQNLKNIENEIKSLRQKDGSIAKEDMPKFKELTVKKNEARDKTRRGNNEENISIRSRPKTAEENPQVLQNSPVNTPLQRLDETKAARDLNLRWNP